MLFSNGKITTFDKIVEKLMHLFINGKKIIFMFTYCYISIKIIGGMGKGRMPISITSAFSLIGLSIKMKQITL